MTALPFSISPDAAAWIAERLQMRRDDTALDGLVPGLYFFLDSQSSYEADGRVFEWCPYPHFDICWERPENVLAYGYAEVELLGVKTFSPPDTLERLQGKHLILETVEVGHPTPADLKRQLLRVVPSES